MNKVYQIFLNAIPVLVMVGLIPLVRNDYILTGVYAAIIVVALLIKRERNDLLVLVFGFFIMIASEYLFISTGVETFQRNSLLGLMPLWLPFLWSYGFVAIKRSVLILDSINNHYDKA
jgi:hypothetical protein